MLILTHILTPTLTLIPSPKPYITIITQILLSSEYSLFTVR